MNEEKEVTLELLPVSSGNALPDYRYRIEGEAVKDTNRWDEFRQFVAENEEMLSDDVRDRESYVRGLSRAFAIARFFLEYV